MPESGSKRRRYPEGEASDQKKRPARAKRGDAAEVPSMEQEAIEEVVAPLEVLDGDAFEEDTFGDDVRALVANTSTDYRAKLVPVDQWGTTINAINRASQGQGVPGFGAHGPIVQGEEEVEPHRLVRNPFHVREWTQSHPEVVRRAASMQANEFGQIDAVIVTPISPENPELYSQGDLLIIDGESIWQAALLNRAPLIKVKVVVSPFTSRGLTPFEATYYWLTRTESVTSPTAAQLAAAFIRLRVFWLDWEGTQGKRPFISQAEIAEHMGVSTSTVQRAYLVSDQPAEILRARAQGLLTDAHIITLTKALPDPAQRVQITEVVVDRSRELLSQGRPIVASTAIPAIVREIFPEPPAPPSPPPRRKAFPPLATSQEILPTDLLLYRAIMVAPDGRLSPLEAAATALLDAGNCLARIPPELLPTGMSRLVGILSDKALLEELYSIVGE